MYKKNGAIDIGGPSRSKKRSSDGRDLQGFLKTEKDRLGGTPYSILPQFSHPTAWLPLLTFMTLLGTVHNRTHLLLDKISNSRPWHSLPYYDWKQCGTFRRSRIYFNLSLTSKTDASGTKFVVTISPDSTLHQFLNITDICHHTIRIAKYNPRKRTWHSVPTVSSVVTLRDIVGIDQYASGTQVHTLSPIATKLKGPWNAAAVKATTMLVSDNVPVDNYLVQMTRVHTIPCTYTWHGLSIWPTEQTCTLATQNSYHPY